MKKLFLIFIGILLFNLVVKGQSSQLYDGDYYIENVEFVNYFLSINQDGQVVLEQSRGEKNNQIWTYEYYGVGSLRDKVSGKALNHVDFDVKRDWIYSEIQKVNIDLIEADQDYNTPGCYWDFESYNQEEGLFMIKASKLIIEAFVGVDADNSIGLLPWSDSSVWKFIPVE